MKARVVVGLAILVCRPAFALDPARTPSQYVLRKWGADDLRGNTVHALLQTRDKYLWMGTSAGLIRYDGHRFVLYSARNTPALGDGGVSVLSEGPDGTLYIGTTSGAVVRKQGGTFETTAIPPGSARVTALLADREGGVWSSSFGANVRYWKEGNKPTSNAFPAQRAGAIVEDPERGVWAGSSDSGLFHRVGDTVTPYPIVSDAVQALRFDRQGSLWIGTPTGLVRRGRDGTLERFGTAQGLTSANVTAILEDRDGNLWVGTKAGLNRRGPDGTWSHVTRSFDRLSDEDVRALLEDHEGNLWVGTADGLNRLSDGSFVTLGRPEGLPEDAIASVAPGRDGAVWAGTDGGTLLRLHRGQVERYAIPNMERGRDTVLALRELADGTLWFTLDSQRLLSMKNGQMMEQSRPPADEGPGAFWTTRGFAADEKGGPLFLVTGLGVARYDRRHNRFIRYLPAIPPTARGRFPRFPHLLTRDAEGSYWFCDRGGLARYKKGQWSVFDDTKGLPNDRVRWATIDENGGVWAATAGGLGFVKDDVVRAVTVKEGLPEGYLRVVLDDRRGHLWIASTGNLFRLEKQQLFDLFAGRRRELEPRIFDTSDGLRTTEILLSNNPAFRAEDGRLWFATAKGIAVVDPAKLSRNAVPPTVHIEEVLLDGRRYAPEARVESPPGKGDLAIRYAGLSYTVPERVRFKYRLEGRGGDETWVEANDRRDAIYTNLRPGPYKFRVMACNNDAVWAEAAQPLDLYIAPHFYQTRWFAVLAASLVVAAVFASHQARVRYLKAREKVLSRRVEEGLSQIKVLRGLLPTCSSCKKIRDENGSWNAIEIYIRDHSEANFSHGVCPECMARLYPEYIRRQ